MRFRLLLDARSDGRWNMALDEALLACAGEGSGAPTIRLYGFSPPTLSVGRFQKAKDLLRPQAMERDGVIFVRRPTGGHAVLHDDELTYAVCFSRLYAQRELGGFRKRTVYMFVADILMACIEALGVKGLPSETHRGDPRNPDCFASTGEYEIHTPSGRKLIGSAQVTSRTGILQHGSVPIKGGGGRVFSYLAATEVPGMATDMAPEAAAAASGAGIPEASGAGIPAASGTATAAVLDSASPSSLCEETGHEMSFEEVRDSFARTLRRDFDAEEGTLSGREEETARRLLADKYARDEWNLQH